MSCNSAIYTVNATNSAVTTTAGTFVQVPFGSVIRRFGKNLQLDGGSILMCGFGYYDCEVTATLVPTGTDPVTVQLRKDGALVPGATVTVTPAAGDYVALPIGSVVRNCGCDCNAALTLWVDAPCTVSNLATKVVKI